MGNFSAEAAGNEAKTCRTAPVLLFPHPAAWTIVLVLAGLELAWISLSRFELHFNSSLWWIIAAFGMFAAAILSARTHERLSIFLFTAAFIILFGKEARVLNYLATAIGMPFVDPLFARIDNMIGFDWQALVSWVNGNFYALSLLELAYNSHKLLFFVTILYLLHRNMVESLRKLLVIFAVTALATIVIGALLPATGALYYYAPPAEVISNLPENAGRYFLPHLLPLNAGTMQLIDLDKMVGLVAFPSFHTIMALIMIQAMRDTPLRRSFIVMNSLMIAATPVFGGHYLTDILGGAIVFAVSAAVYDRWPTLAAGIMNSRSNAKEAGTEEVRI